MAPLLAQLPPWWIVAAVFAIVMAAAIVQAGLGMGYGLMAAPLLALLAPELVPVPTIWMGLATAAWAAWTDRGDIRWREVWIGSAGRMTGVVIGVAVLSLVAGAQGFSLVFGLMVGLAVLLSLIGWRLALNPATLVGMGTLSGMMGTITGVGAPPMALIYHGRTATHARPTLSAFFTVGCVLSLAGLYLSGIGDAHDIVLAALLVPPMVLGTALARRMKTRFDRRYRPLLLAVSGSAALLLVLKGLA